MPLLFLSNEQIESLLSWAEVVQVCEKLIVERANGTAWFSPRERFLLPSSSVLVVMPGGAMDAGFMGTRVYSQPAGHPRTANQHALGTSSVNVVFDIRSAEMLAVTAGEWINTLRTAAIGAVGTKYLANSNARRVGIFGTGMLALGSLMALREIYPLERAKVFSRDPQHRINFSKKLTEMAGFPVTASGSPGEVLDDIDILVTATSATRETGPVFDGRLLKSGTHVNCIGGYVQGGGREMDEIGMGKCNVLSVLNKEHAMKGGMWEDQPNANFANAVEKKTISWDSVVEIADIVAGKAKGRQSPDDITFLDSRGMGAFDLALAHRAYELAIERSVGTTLDWGKRPDPGWQAQLRTSAAR